MIGKEPERPALKWQETGNYCQAYVPAHTLGPRGIPVSAWTCRVYRRSSPDCFELFSWSGDQVDPAGGGKGFDSLEDAKEEADRRDSWNYFGPYDGILDGFLVQWRSDIDGDRYLIIDERDYDMTGWKIEVQDDDPSDSWWRRNAAERGEPVPPPPPPRAPRFNALTRDDGWYAYDPGGGFRHLGFGDAERRYPWTAFCDHGQHVVRFVPPQSGGGEQK